MWRAGLKIWGDVVWERDDPPANSVDRSDVWAVMCGRATGKHSRMQTDIGGEVEPRFACSPHCPMRCPSWPSCAHTQPTDPGPPARQTVAELQGLPSSPVIAINGEPAAAIEAPMQLRRAELQAMIERCRR